MNVFKLIWKKIMSFIDLATNKILTHKDLGGTTTKAVTMKEANESYSSVTIDSDKHVIKDEYKTTGDSYEANRAVTNKIWEKDSSLPVGTIYSGVFELQLNKIGQSKSASAEVSYDSSSLADVLKYPKGYGRIVYTCTYDEANKLYKLVSSQTGSFVDIDDRFRFFGMHPFGDTTLKVAGFEVDGNTSSPVKAVVYFIIK